MKYEHWQDRYGNLHIERTGHPRVYLEWLKAGNTGDLDAFMAAITQSSGDPEPGTDGLQSWVHTLGSRFLLDPNEFVGWQTDGVYDQTLLADLGDVGANPTRHAGGLCYPFDVRVKRLFAWHYNSNPTALGWGWRLGYQTKTAGSNAVSWQDIHRECTGTGATAVPFRNYLSTLTQNTNVDLSGSVVVPAGSVICLGVEAPTAIGTNYYVQVMSGYLEIERV